MLTPLLTLVATIAVLLAAVVWLCQRRLIYFPRSQDVPPVASVLLGAEEISFDTPDGLRLSGWFAPSTATVAGATVLVFNGNAGDRSFRAPLAAALNQAGLSVLLFDYRGYGRNPGSPSEKGLVTDARTARAYAAARDKVDAGRLVYFGESLGAAVAVALALEHPPAALVLRSPFTSLTDMGRQVLPIGAHQSAPARSLRLVEADWTPHLPGPNYRRRSGPHRPPGPEPPIVRRSTGTEALCADPRRQPQ